MTNLIVSRRCNQKCSYCFAEDELSRAREQTSQDTDFISTEIFDQRLDYLERSGITQARLLGGEPTLHPQFSELVQRIRMRGLKVVVFTNGLMPEASLVALENLSLDECGVIMNVTPLNNNGCSENTRRQGNTLKRLGQKAQVGCNIFHEGQDLSFLIERIVTSGCKQAVRIGLAQPVLDGTNQYLPTRSYRWVGEQLFQFARNAARDGIRIELDCGFVPCMFSDEALGRLGELNADLGWRCNPIIDLDINGKAFHCFPLSGKYWTDLRPADTASGLREAFQEKTRPYRQTGIFKECSICPKKIEQVCSGGCLAHTIKRFSTQPVHVYSVKQQQ